MKQPIQKFTTAPAPSGTPVIALPKRAYEGDAPIPMISARTLTLFHDKPPKEPVKNLDHPVVGTKSAGHPLETINIGTANQPNKAAQAWKHMLSSFRLSPKGGGDPPVALKRKIEATFGIPDSWEATINPTFAIRTSKQENWPIFMSYPPGNEGRDSRIALR